MELPPPPQGHTLETWARALASMSAEHARLAKRYIIRSQIRSGSLIPILNRLDEAETHANAAAHMLDGLTLAR